MSDLKISAEELEAMLDRSAKRALESIGLTDEDRKSTRLNSSHLVISYAVFCLKKKKNNQTDDSIENTLLDDQNCSNKIKKNKKP